MPVPARRRRSGRSVDFQKRSSLSATPCATPAFQLRLRIAPWNAGSIPDAPLGVVPGAEQAYKTLHSGSDPHVARTRPIHVGDLPRGDARLSPRRHSMRSIHTLLRFLVRGGWLLAIALVPSPVFGQATIAGIVRDTSGAVLPGVTVEASSNVLIEKTR